VSKTGLLDIIFPSRCAVCEAPGANLCQGCEFILTPNPHSFQRGQVAGLAATTYSPELAKLLIAFKDRGQFALARQLGQLMEPLAKQLLEFSEPCYLVPAPSRIQNFLRRGFHPSLLLARQLSKRVPSARVLNCLQLEGGVLDQVGLSSVEREANLKDKMRVNQPVAGKPVFLIDDVVTTGATLVQAFETVSVAGAIVTGALVVSEARH